VNIDISINRFNKNCEALADTGASNHGIFLPEEYFQEDKVDQKFFTVPVHTSDGTDHNWKAYLGTVTINGKDFLTSIVITEDKKEIILGRELLNRLISVFEGPTQKLILNTP